ncbi:hypothetical protein EV426DRAFT_620991 [Tirmania nivea]|nr:hypothetical protein EV426DRAFT_620991 [Tirmania nivea]
MSSSSTVSILSVITVSTVYPIIPFQRGMTPHTPQHLSQCPLRGLSFISSIPSKVACDVGEANVTWAPPLGGHSGGRPKSPLYLRYGASC